MTAGIRRFAARHRRTFQSICFAAIVYFCVAFFVLRRVDPASEAPVDLVIALGSDVRDDSTLSNVGSERLRGAIEFARVNRVPMLVTTRVRRNDGLTSDRGQHRIVDSSRVMTEWRILNGVAETTRDEAERLRGFTAARRIAVVTSRLHTRRACATFERLEFEVTCVASGSYVWWKVPYGITYESLALIKYRIKGWI
jgi:uncharacterized SAM-binding protein YcdF (DUF218 family)